ncbi:Alkaline phosphatase [Desulfosporosinus orientis DSM 765]|uniref:Alkaline phosphatase n=1 Tax=Desulfosporosinus orientis (strain ATCC 19365 / DSM 765 / NCIMB 8382 / VKM B-1628 / Singapore I) TaxID=768706 RepID=G7WA58_DESOD|nr:alkaline phosphatase [Desulfosporosinus orientis]AET66196.1 Alkaline phosphatase [Desulfosporosinus orientis DSM 765]
MFKKNHFKGIASICVIGTILISLVAAQPNLGIAKSANEEIYKGKTPKYVFMFIGDGMSYAQISSAEMYLGEKSMPGKLTPEQLSFTKFPVHGSLMTQDSSSFIPDSASTATSLASGHKTLSGVINMDETKTHEYKPITEDLKAKGYKIGIITSVPITHATPAAYYAKVANRNDAYEIGKQLAASGFDYFGGGDFDQKTGPEGTDQPIYDIVEEAGYTIANTKEEIQALNNRSGKVVAIDPDDYETALDYEIDREPGELALADYVKKGIDVLNNNKGFFMMVEGGKIDWANHANDAAASIYDTVAFDDSVKVALDFYNAHPKDTLILVTADHECGGMTIGYSLTGYSTHFEKLQPVTMSYQEFDKISKLYKGTNPANPKLEDLSANIKEAYGLDLATLTPYEASLLNNAFAKFMSADTKPANDQESVLYGTYNPLSVTLSHIMNNRAGLSFTTYSHTGVPVPIYAVGTGSELFDGYYDNTKVYYKLASITQSSQAK